MVTLSQLMGIPTYLTWFHLAQRGPSGIFPDFNYPYILMKPCTQFKSPVASLYAFIQPQRKPVRTGSWTEVTPPSPPN